MTVRIIAAQRLRRSLYALTIETVGEVQVDVRTFDESPYWVGGEITQAQLDRLLEQAQYNRARDKALYLLGLRDYGCRELERKLTPEYPPAVAAAVVARLAEVGLLDDVQYAARAARSLSRYKQYPRRRVQQELQRRGIDRETAAAAAEELVTDDFQQALAILQKKYYNKLHDRTDRAARQRVMASLARRGFSFSAIRQAMEAFDQAAGEETGTEDEEYEELWQ